MEKLTRNGQVAVVYSPDHGAGWYSWHHDLELLFHPDIVTWLETDQLDKIKTYLILKYPNQYFGDLEDLTIRWLPEGTRFVIDEYDGAETIKTESETEWMVA